MMELDMSEFCIIDDAQELSSRLHSLLCELPEGEFRTALHILWADLETIIEKGEAEAQSLSKAADKWEDKYNDRIEEYDRAQETILDLEEERDALREKIHELTNWRGVLAADPDPYDLHGLHDGNDTGHSWYARFWEKFRRTFTNPNTAE